MSQLGKVALVTGGAQGIGRSCVKHLLAEGAKVSICDLRKDLGDEAVEELSKTYPDKVIFLECDVSNHDNFEECFKKTTSRFGGLDIVVNNAGIAQEWSSPFQKTVGVNLIGVISGTKLGFQYMSKEKGGRGGMVVNMGSITALEPFPTLPVYSATKAAVNQFTRSYGHDVFYKKSGVKTIAINPGMTATPLASNSKEHYKDYPELWALFKTNFTLYKSQSADNVAKGIIHLLQNAENGTLWTIHNDEPPFLTDLSKPAI